VLVLAASAHSVEIQPLPLLGAGILGRVVPALHMQHVRDAVAARSPGIAGRCCRMEGGTSVQSWRQDQIAKQRRKTDECNKKQQNTLC
jgi:hypothetical protein